MKLRTIIIWGLMLLPLMADAQTARDSLLQFLTENRSEVEQLIGNYKKVTFNWEQLAATFAIAILFVSLTWKFWGKEKLAEYVRKKSQEAIDNMNNLKSTKILVLTSEQGDDTFIKSFFENKKFPNIKYIRIANEVKRPDDFDFELVFANNYDKGINTNVVRQYLNENIALFYFGPSNSWDYQNDTPPISRTINFANSRAQIYGNIMSSLEFLDLVNPKIKNV